MITFFWKEWDHPCLLVKISKSFPVFMIKPFWIGWNPPTPFAKYSKKIPAFLLRRFRISEEEKNIFLHECFPFSETIQPNHLWHHGPTYAYSHRWGEIHLHSFSHKIFNTQKHTLGIWGDGRPGPKKIRYGPSKWKKPKIFSPDFSLPI